MALGVSVIGQRHVLWMTGPASKWKVQLQNVLYARHTLLAVACHGPYLPPTCIILLERCTVTIYFELFLYSIPLSFISS